VLLRYFLAEADWRSELLEQPAASTANTTAETRNISRRRMTGLLYLLERRKRKSQDRRQ
jgi:hypothetical protein